MIATETGDFLEVEARLTATTDTNGTVHSARVKNFDVSYACANLID